MRQIDLTDFNAEALLVDGGLGGDEVWLLSDDSSRAIGGVPCSELGDAAQRSFRSLRLR
jgi:hypothetical protein